MGVGDFIALEIECKPEFVQILIAELAEMGFDTFEERDNGLTTYAQSEHFDNTAFNNVIDRYREAASILVTQTGVRKKNWNKEWETNYDPIIIADKCLVRADFHPPQPQYPFEIVINPRMSFGTGHHETTYLMLAGQMELDHADKRVLDAGCGTGILSIMAGMLGASDIVAYDNDEWVIDNVKENLILNNQQASVLLGTISELDLTDPFDILLANINKNVLLDNMLEFAAKLKIEGDLLLSGFYMEDLEDLKNAASKQGLMFVSAKEKNDWAMAQFKNN